MRKTKNPDRVVTFSVEYPVACGHLLHRVETPYFQALRRLGLPILSPRYEGDMEIRVHSCLKSKAHDVIGGVAHTVIQHPIPMTVRTECNELKTWMFRGATKPPYGELLGEAGWDTYNEMHIERMRSQIVTVESLSVHEIFDRMNKT